MLSNFIRNLIQRFVGSRLSKVDLDGRACVDFNASRADVTKVLREVLSLGCVKYHNLQILPVTITVSHEGHVSSWSGLGGGMTTTRCLTKAITVAD